MCSNAEKHTNSTQTVTSFRKFMILVCIDTARTYNCSMSKWIQRVINLITECILIGLDSCPTRRGSTHATSIENTVLMQQELGVDSRFFTLLPFYL